VFFDYIDILSDEYKLSFISTTKAANICGVARTTVSKWIDEGALEAFVTPGGHRKIREEDFRYFLKKNGLRPHTGLRERKRILIVDDNPDDIRLLEAAFLPASDKYQVHSANSGFQAIYKIGEIKPHIVILDIVMPDMDGFQVCQSIKKNPKTRDIKIIVVTAYSDERKEKKALKLGTDAFFRKPVDLTQLVEKILEFSRVSE